MGRFVGISFAAYKPRVLSADLGGRAAPAVVQLVRGGLILLLCGVGLPVWGCGEQVKTELEAVFCRVKREAPSVPLPSFREFQKNPAKTQRLLLRRPARKLGIALPVESTTPAANPGVPSTSNSSQPPAPRSSNLSTADLQECSLQGARILCADGTYLLQRNRSNQAVSKDALDKTSLEIASPPDAKSPQAVAHYLTQSYRNYIHAMLNIGLAEATLSYTKYNHIFQEVQQQGGNFPQRMSTMFTYLKKDKQQMSAVGRPATLLPQSLDQCQRLDTKIILCDNVVENWIFAHGER